MSEPLMCGENCWWFTRSADGEEACVMLGNSPLRKRCGQPCRKSADFLHDARAVIDRLLAGQSAAAPPSGPGTPPAPPPTL